jgi:RNA polymerase sigma factor (sigma-70 family)
MTVFNRGTRVAHLCRQARRLACDGGLNTAHESPTSAGRRGDSRVMGNYPFEGNALENAIHFNDYKRYLAELLATLTPQSREVFRLCRQEGRTYDETAELLGISRNAVKKHMVRPMRIIRESVEKDLGVSLAVLLAFF